IAVEMMAAPGRVNSQAYRIRLVTPHRTADSRLIAPTPMTDDVIVWVVLTGKPIWAVNIKTVAAAVSAAKPCTGSSFTIFIPKVRTMRHPPTAVPNPIATAQAPITHVGTSADGI